MVQIYGVTPNPNVDTTGKPLNSNTDEYGNPIGAAGGGSLGYISPGQSDLAIQGEKAGRYNASIYYGTPGELGAAASDIRGRLKSRLDQPSGLANQMTQASNAQIARSSAAAGLGGVDTSARNIAEQRQNLTQANAAQQAQDQINLSNYQRAIGAGISGTESLAAAGAGRGTAATPTPIPSYGGGLFGSIICTELYRQKKITLKDLNGCRNFGEKLSPETYQGYLIIAKPIVKLMKKSDRFSNIFINWAKCISKNEPNLFTRLMIPVCNFIGGVYVRLAKEKEVIRAAWSK